MFLDPKLAELAATELAEISPKFSDVEAAAIQTMMDFNMRCILPGPMVRSFDMIVEAAVITGVETMVIVSQNKNWWESRKLASSIPMIIKQVNKPEIFDSDFIRENRHHLLIFDPNAFNQAAQGLFAHSFPKAIGITNDVAFGKLKPMVDLLFPKAPTELLELNGIQRREMEVKGIRESQPADLAFLLNIVTDHLPRNGHEEAVKAMIFGDGDDDPLFQ